MKPVHAKRLLKLAEFLEQLPRNKFDYNTFEHDDPKCGTVACAIGWTPHIPAFKRLGVGIKQWGQTSTMPVLHGDFISYRGIAEHLFGVVYGDYDRLFFPTTYHHSFSGLPGTATPKQVARHIRKFVKEEQR